MERNTEQKQVIFDCLSSICTHPTAEAIYQIVRKEIPTISLATVYRNLNLMAEKGKILRLEVNKEYHYDGDIGAHQHFVCGKCGEIQDIFDQKISKYALNRAKDAGMQTNSVSVIFHGNCPECK